MDRNEKYWIKNARERSNLSGFDTIRELKLQVRVLVFSVLNVCEFVSLYAG